MINYFKYWWIKLENSLRWSFFTFIQTSVRGANFQGFVSNIEIGVGLAARIQPFLLAPTWHKYNIKQTRNHLLNSNIPLLFVNFTGQRNVRFWSAIKARFNTPGHDVVLATQNASLSLETGSIYPNNTSVSRSNNTRRKHTLYNF